MPDDELHEFHQRVALPVNITDRTYLGRRPESADTYTMQYVLNVQRTSARSTLEVGYNGSQSRKVET